MSDVKQVAALAAIDANGTGAWAEFARHGDRYTHQLVAQDNAGGSCPLLTAVEDRLHHAWPCSPVTQGLNMDDLRRYDPGDAPAAMLIGMAGDGHWSMTVERDRDQSKCGLVFDVACRVKSLPPRLTSTYRLGEAVKSTKIAVGVLLECHIGSFELRPVAFSKISDSASCQIELTATEVCLVTEITWESPVPATIQWRYGLWKV